MSHGGVYDDERQRQRCVLPHDTPLMAPSSSSLPHHPPSTRGATNVASTATMDGAPTMHLHFPLPSPSSCASDESFRVSRPTLLRYAHRTHSVGQQVRALLHAAKVLPMEELCRCVRVPPSTTTTRGGAADDMDAPVDSTQPRLLLPHLRRHAVLVCGVWVVAYDPEFPVPWAAVREWILLRFALPRDGDGNNNTDTGDPQPHGPLLGSLPLQHGVLYHHELMAELPNDVAFRRWVHAMLCSMATHAHRDDERCWRLRYVSTVGDAQSTCGRVWLSAPSLITHDSHCLQEAAEQRKLWEIRAADITNTMELVRSGQDTARDEQRVAAGVSGEFPRDSVASPWRQPRLPWFLLLHVRSAASNDVRWRTNAPSGSIHRNGDG